MKYLAKLLSVLIILCCLCSTSCHEAKTLDNQSLKVGFVTPDDSITTSIYWYWMSGNISKEGVLNDLEAMKKAGINRAFIGNVFIPEVPEGKVILFSNEWFDIVHAALKRAGELGIDIGMFNCPGWSQVGGPWIKPNQAMRYLAATQTQVAGGHKLSITLKTAGKDFQDVRVIAFPDVSNAHSTITFNNLKINKDSSTINFNVQEPFTLRNVMIYTAHKHTRAHATLQVKKGNTYQTLTEFEIDRTNESLNVGFEPYAPISIGIPATEGSHFRILLTHVESNSALDRVELSSIPKVERYAEKSLAKMCQTPFPYWHEYQWKPQDVLDKLDLAVDPAKIIDLTHCLSGNQLNWDAPEGKWIVMRCGMLPTGTENAPAEPLGAGLEVDKMTSDYLQYHFDHFLGRIMDSIPAQDRKAFKVAVNDSYEVGGQNFTDSFFVDFKKIYKYDPLPYLPVFSGVVVKNQDVSDRFLWDVRRMVADQLAYKHIGGFRDLLHKYGLTSWLECYGHWGFDGEFLQYGGQADEIGGEFWTRGALGNIENRAASSCGHTYGKNRISCESFTAGGSGFDQYPATIKARGDRFFSEGVNNTLLHVFISQTENGAEPGLNAPFGTEFNRKNTWFSQLDLFTSYLKRTNYMLQQGHNIADIAYFIGEDAPKMTGITDPALPQGYQFDYINGETILNRLTVKDGILTLPHGTQYRILVLPQLETMRPELLAKIKQLVLDGAVILGPAPKRSPSLENYPQCDQQVQTLAAELWGKVDGVHQKSAHVGKGMVINGMDLTAAMQLINQVPDCQLAASDSVLFGHRESGNVQIYFLSNQSHQAVTVTPTFRVSGMQPELWSPVTGESRLLPAFLDDKKTTTIPLKLSGSESTFIVFRNKATTQPKHDIRENYPMPKTLATLGSNWILTFDVAKRGPVNPVALNQLIDLSTSNQDSIRYYSGTISYKNTFQLAGGIPKGEVYLNLGKVVAMAKVKINGKYVGGVWTAPYRVNISKALLKGENTIEVDVVNTWVNRLIGDAKLPQSARKTSCPINPWNADSKLQESGLIGPVSIESFNYPMN